MEHLLWKFALILCLIQASLAKPSQQYLNEIEEYDYTTESETSTNDNDYTTISREKRSLNIPGYDPYTELQKFQEIHYMTRDEENLILEEKDSHTREDVIVLRMITANFDDLDQRELYDINYDGSDTGNRTEARYRARCAILKTFAASDSISCNASEEINDKVVNDVLISDIVEYEGLDELNRTQSRVFAIVLISSNTSRPAKEIYSDILRNSTPNELGYLMHFKTGFNATVEVDGPLVYAPVPEKTVFQATVRLTTLTYMPQFRDLNNTATLKITNALTLLTRPMFRYCFGEFFFRSVVMNYFQGPILGDTIVFMGFLLEASEYNVVDVDTVWKTQAATGMLGEYPITKDNYLIYEVRYVPIEFKQFLKAEVTRADRILDTVEFMTIVGLPAFFGMLSLFFLIAICSWEGMICKFCFEEGFRVCCSKRHKGLVKYDDMPINEKN